jgi:hypothetical protein
MRTRRLIVMWIFAVATHVPQTPQHVNPLESKLVTGSQTTTSVNHISSLLRLARVWGGIESYGTDCAPPAEYRIPPIEGTLQDGLVQLKSQDNSLIWKIQGDGILISRHPQLTSILDTKLSEFSFYGSDAPDKTTDRLLNLPVVKDQIARLKLTLRPPELGFAQLPVNAGPQKQISLKSLTLRQALNAIAGADHPRVWLYEQSTCAGQTTILVQWLVK